MADTTPTYGWPYQEATDPPDGASLGEDLALAVEATVSALATATTHTVGTNGTAANTTGSTSTTPVLASTPISVTFVAPASGKILFVGQVIAQSSSTGNGQAGVMIRAGGTPGSGTIVYDPSTEPNAKMSQNMAAGTLGASVVDIVTGLTPGATYHGSVVQWTASGTVTLFAQKLTIAAL